MPDILAEVRKMTMESMTAKAIREATMNMQKGGYPPGTSEADINNAGQVKRPTDADIENYVEQNTPGDPCGVEITNDDGEGIFVTIHTYISYDEVER